MGMGGAGVAASEGAVGAYWNPASLGRAESPSGVQIPADVHAEITGQFLAGANDLHDIANACQNSLTNPLCTQPHIDAALAKLNDPTNGLRADASVGAQVKIKKLAVFVNNLVASRILPDEVRSLRNRDYWVITPEGASRTPLTSAAQLRRLLELELGVRVTDAEAIRLFDATS